MDLISAQSLFQQGMFSIPNYQRGYAWQQQQVKEFLEDLQEAVEGNVGEHYTGTITVIQKGEKTVFPKNFKIFDVVDGQQRLTTITIFIFAVHNRLKALGSDEDALSDILKTIIYRKEAILQLNNDSDQFYREFILDKTVIALPNSYSNKAQLNLANAKKQITRFLDGYKKIREVEKIYDCLMTKFKVNFYSLSKESDVGVVFETMNNRGLSLTQIDKVKNYLVYLAARMNDEKLSSYINDNFGQIFRELMKIEATTTQENEVLRYSYIVYKGINEPDVHTQIKTDLLDKKTATKPKIIEYVDFLKKSSELYSKIRRGEFKNERVKSLIHKIIWLGNPANFIPLLMSLFECYEESQLIQVLEAMEVFSFRVYKIGNRQGKAVQSKLHKLAYEIHNRQTDLKNLKKELTDNRYANDNDFRLALENGNFFNSQDSTEIAYFFYEYECFLHEQTKSGFKLLDFQQFGKDTNSTKLTIEHIEPQTPANRDPSANLHKIGNLLITYDNSALSNKEFNIKRDLYKKSKLLVENEVAQKTRWEDSDINTRTQELVHFVFKRWELKTK
jgi:Protein of unknown function DUF262/Protein of unknown function (DUF1524)